ncbi:helix-turn-helix domain-containing protein [Martelella alba]|nr:helix-turn-helix domain-containing protein [Martelella alba]
MEKQFSTRDISAGERFDYWHELVYRTYAPCSGRVSSVSGFNASLRTQEFGTTEISDVSSTGITYERKAFDVRRGPRDDFFVSFMVSGEGRFEQNGNSVMHRAGDILLYDSGRPYSYSYDQAYRSILMRIPRPIASSRLVDVDRLGGVILSGGSPFGKLLGTLLGEAHNLATSVESDVLLQLSPSMLDMIAAAVRQGTGDTAADGAASRSKIEQIKRYLNAHMADSSLTLQQVAREQNVSVRTLCRLFAETGTTPMGWLQTRRLQAAYSAISERRVRSITDAALDFGFNDLSHFGRSFKKEFGVTPKSLL